MVEITEGANEMSNTGSFNTGNYNSGHRNTGHYNAGDYNAGSCNTGYYNTGHHNTGNGNTGNHNSGNYNVGDYNTGHKNTGNDNAGCYNTGYRNTGYRNTGHHNTGNHNTGICNTGHHNTSNHHTGFFNTKLPEKVYCFNQPVDYDDFDNAMFPNWIQMITPTTWVRSEDMTDQEKQDYPSHETTGGYLRKNDLKQEYRKAFEQATQEDIELTKKLPGFDPDVFLEITGIDLR